MSVPSLKATLLDQSVRELAKRYDPQLSSLLRAGDEKRKISLAFTANVLKTTLQISTEEALHRITDGGNDLGIDGIDVGPVSNGEFEVVLFQCKYHFDLDEERQYPQTAIEKIIQAIPVIFDLQVRVTVNERLARRIAMVHAKLRSGYLPRARVVLASNGRSWKTPEAQELVSLALARFKNRLSFEHVNHERLIAALSGYVRVDEVLQLVGKAHVDDGYYMRTLEGSLSAGELARVVERHDPGLFSQNLRGYFGPYTNPVNAAIMETLEIEAQRRDFRVLNNGLVFVCDRFEYNSLQQENYKVRVEDLRLINGGQTSRVIAGILANRPRRWLADGEDEPRIKIRLHQVGGRPDAEQLTRTITITTNNQTVLELVDLYSGNEEQRDLEQSIKLLGYVYRRQRSAGILDPDDITISVAAEAVLSVWRHQPQRANERITNSLNQHYAMIFSPELNSAQLIIAVLLLRAAQRLSAALALDPEWDDHHLAMQMGKALLRELDCSLEQLDHQSFAKAEHLLRANELSYYSIASSQVGQALQRINDSSVVSKKVAKMIFDSGMLLEILEGGDEL